MDWLVDIAVSVQVGILKSKTILMSTFSRHYKHRKKVLNTNWMQRRDYSNPSIIQPLNNQTFFYLYSIEMTVL